LRTKTLITASLAALVVTAAIFHIARTILARSFAEIETDTVKQSVERVRRAIEADLGQLEATTSDYARWTETYDFVLSHDENYVGANFTRDALMNLRIDVAWIADAHGQTRIGLAVDRAADRLVPLTSDELSTLREYAPLFEAAGQRPARAQLLRLPRGPLAFVAVPIVRTDRSGPTAGMLLFGRYLDAAQAARAAQTSQLPVAVTPFDPSRIESMPLPLEVRRWLASSPLPSTQFVQLSGARISYGYTLLRDIRGEPLAVLSTGVRRDVLQLGQHAITAVILALIVGFALVVLALLAILNKTWREREATERRYRTVAQQLDDSLLLAQAETGTLIEANPAVAKMLGYESAEILRLKLQDLSASLTPAKLSRIRDRQNVVRRSVMMRNKQGARLPVEVTMTWLHIERQPLVCVVARDITAQRKAERQQRHHRRRLARLAHHDSLTALPNRLFLQERLPKLIANADREQSLLALLYVDLDHFKDVNDSLGHTSGDRLLSSVAKRLRACVAASDLVVRMGGDEFVIVATGLPAPSAVDYIARRIQETLSAAVDIDGVKLGVMASIGISLYPNDGANLEQLLKHADIALYQAKGRGRGNHQFFTDAMKARLNDRLELEHALRRSVGTDQLFLEYQPSFDMQTRKPVSFEALLRWNHPELGLVPPGRFIPIAEQGSLILELGAWSLRRVCKQLHEWRMEGRAVLPVSINVTPRQFEHGRLVDMIAGLTREFDIEPNLLHFEITESAVMHNSEQHLGGLQALRQLGSRIMIDDFGTGYSSLSYLKHLPIDTLKIDRAFVRDMATDPNDAAIVSAIVGIAESLGLQLVAEGVETAEQVDCLLRLGCHTAQGFFFSRPLPAAQVAHLLPENVGAPARRAGDNNTKLRLLQGGGGSSTG
jgi:diguanylate cyclase (GGDEF)-like protein/PAS domain S-box-containing protein